MPEINGIAHIQLTVTDLEKSIPFYRKLLTGMGLTLVLDSPFGIYGVGGRTGVCITPSEDPYNHESFKQRHPGLHHFCFRARSRKDVDEIHDLAVEIGATIVHPPREDGFAPGYYSVLFEDPDGIRIEANHVPGEGLLAPGLGQVGSAETQWS
ncbi:MAG: VOC family protein [Gammaproteobacteria bacterium]|nr:VOC family protein [Gammaproteobacteria bacterium]